MVISTAAPLPLRPHVRAPEGAGSAGHAPPPPPLPIGAVGRGGTNPGGRAGARAARRGGAAEPGMVVVSRRWSHVRRVLTSSGWREEHRNGPLGCRGSRGQPTRTTCPWTSTCPNTSPTMPGKAPPILPPGHLATCYQDTGRPNQGQQLLTIKGTKCDRNEEKKTFYFLCFKIQIISSGPSVNETLIQEYIFAVLFEWS